MKIALVAVIVLAGCATSPEYVASRGDFDVCRLSMGGPHARAADAEATRRGLNCPAMYAAILEKQAAESAAWDAIGAAGRQLMTPAPAANRGPAWRPPVSCTSRRVGSTIQTDCD